MQQVLEGASADQVAGLHTFFSETGEGRYVPRSINVDLEPSTADHVRSSNIGRLFKPDSVISSQSGAGNNWAKVRPSLTALGYGSDAIPGLLHRRGRAC